MHVNSHTKKIQISLCGKINLNLFNLKKNLLNIPKEDSIKIEIKENLIQVVYISCTE